MRWNRNSRSPDVIDERGRSPLGAGMGGGGLINLLISLVASRYGALGALLAIGAVYLLSNYGGMNTAPQAPEQAGRVADSSRPPDERMAFVSFVLDDVQSTWARIFERDGKRYRHAKLVLFDGATTTACGYGQSATGPFYCPEDQRVYLDVSFFRELDQKLGAPGDFADAYVIAHEVGHHVQAQLGTMEKKQRGSSTGASGTSVRIELQADCYAGVWAKSTAQRKLLEAGDLEEALRATAAIGDDRLQRMSRGSVQPEKWTHGSSAQRTEWFQTGYENGDPAACDTFRTASR